MSNHFTYEIDERKLRVKLKDLETPLNEDAWQKFEAFYSANNKQTSSDIFKNIQIPLSRNVILPLVFGGIIILFSFLLFNFIDIKNPPKEDIQKVAVPEVPAAKPQIEQTRQKVVVPQETRTPAKEIKQEVKRKEGPVVNPTPGLVARQAPVTNSTPTLVAKPLPIVNPTPSLVARSVPVMKPAVVQPNMAARSVPTTTVPPAKTISQATTQAIVSPPKIPANTPAVTKADTAKKQKRRLPEMVEAEHSPDARPALTTDEREAEIRPN